MRAIRRRPDQCGSSAADRRPDVTREATAPRSDGSVLEWREARDDSELRRSLDAFLRDPASVHVSGGTAGTPGFGQSPDAADGPASPPVAAARRSTGLVASTIILLLLGGMLAIAGAALLADTITGSHVFDQARLADAWPPALVLVGLITIADALVLRSTASGRGRSPAVDGHVPPPGPRGSIAPQPAVAIPVMPGPALASLPASPTSAAPAAAPAAPVERAQEARRPEPEATTAGGLPEDEPAATGADVRPAPDALAVLLELQALRRNRLISRKQYRAKRRAVVAGIAPRFVGSPWPDDGTGGHSAEAGSARPLAYWGPTAE
jgi:hypothetical protein